MTACIVRSRALVTPVPGGSDCDIKYDGAVFVQDGTVQEVSTYGSLSQRFPGVPVHGTSDDIAVPGLINAHHHVGLTPFQLGASDLPLELWVAARMAAREVDPYLDTLYSAFELVASGVTTVHHIFDTAEGTLREVKDRLDAVIRAYRDIGMRASVSYSIADQNHFVHQSNEKFLAGLPDALSRPLRAILACTEAGLDGGLELFQSLYAEHQASSRISIQLAPANLHWCSDHALTRISEISESHGVPMHMHLLETPFQRDYAIRTFGESAVAHLQRFGLLGKRLTLGHGVWLSRADLELLAASGTSVCINCSSNLRLSSGRAPLMELEKSGVNTAIGIDEAGLNDDRDMLQEMRLLHTLHRDPGTYGAQPSANQILRMATSGGAETTSFAGTIGAIEPGLRADITLIDYRKLSYPYLDDSQPIADALLRRAKPPHVSLVMCEGEVIYRNEVFCNIDRAAALADLHRLMLHAAKPNEMERSLLAAALAPHIRRFFGFSNS